MHVNIKSWLFTQVMYAQPTCLRLWKSETSGDQGVPPPYAFSNLVLFPGKPVFPPCCAACLLPGALSRLTAMMALVMAIGIIAMTGTSGRCRARWRTLVRHVGHAGSVEYLVLCLRETDDNPAYESHCPVSFCISAYVYMSLWQHGSVYVQRLS